MKKIKNYIIHALGGITNEENKENQRNCYETGRNIAVARILEYAQSINGMSADSWCKLVYNKLESELEKSSKQEYNENND